MSRLWGEVCLPYHQYSRWRLCRFFRQLTEGEQLRTDLGTTRRVDSWVDLNRMRPFLSHGLIQINIFFFRICLSHEFSPVSNWFISLGCRVPTTLTICGQSGWVFTDKNIISYEGQSWPFILIVFAYILPTGISFAGFYAIFFHSWAPGGCVGMRGSGVWRESMWSRAATFLLICPQDVCHWVAKATIW